MRIKNLEVKGLYGYIDKTINFKEDISILVGINGSGKTSILNLLSWMVKPSLAHLCITEFKTIKLSFTFKDKEYTAECKHNGKALNYSLNSSDNTEKFQVLTVMLDFDPVQFSQDTTNRNIAIRNYLELAPDKTEEKTWNFLKNLPNPTIIGLDRNLYTDDYDGTFQDVSQDPRIYKKNQRSKISPIERVKTIVNKEYRKSKNSILNLTNGLKNHLMLSAFDGSISLDSLGEKPKNKLTLAQIDSAEKRVNEYFLKFEENSFPETEQFVVKKYFEQLKTVTTKFQDNPEDELVNLLFSLNSKQFMKLKKIIKKFEDFEKKSEEIMKMINLYLETLNSFFKDSSKQLLFKEDTSELAFNALDKNGKILKEYKDIGSLSSGEQQIMILFSYLAFNSQDGKLFIIDEPELSLHIKWQEDFLLSLKKITPPFTQVILATHSPIIVGSQKNSAILLLPHNG